ncbi:4'-phosphopantetheinyl transferase superfamily protein [Flavobacterium sp. PL002]|uniref:4'-phosphopantetheinyl transferase family protein n=1 Tax=Flavobacterium sp. PL002 TaxID=1897058 RepID=UPI001787E387|nr:4'-phosphopantetheinyl transferase superfamily protein [Flavobacterium sp. PL002]MBE0393231.1 hypothetical protein [Flavobacterium sp. PL002]
MIGNDIIDLALAKKESNWNRPRFLQKIFTDYEQSLILKAENPEIMVWNLWSRKEAAYKIYNRETGIRAYIPLQLSCNYQDIKSGEVHCNGTVYCTKTTIKNDEIHTIAVTNKEYFNQIIDLSNRNLVLKIKGIPYLTNPITKEKNPVSISHHGRFKAIISLAL